MKYFYTDVDTISYRPTMLLCTILHVRYPCKIAQVFLQHYGRCAMLLVNIETRPKKLLLILRSSCKISSGIYIYIVIDVLHFLRFTFVNRNIAANAMQVFIYTKNTTMQISELPLYDTHIARSTVSILCK